MMYQNGMNTLGKMIIKLPAKIKAEKSENKREGQQRDKYFQCHEDFFPITSYFIALMFGNY